MNTEKTFWGKVKREKPERCWFWQGSKTPTGYGIFDYCGSRVLVHTLAFELSGGEIPDGYRVQHICGNRLCCNPKHLVAAPHKALSGIWKRTAADLEQQYGKPEPKSETGRLSADQIAELRTLYSRGDVTMQTLADRYGITAGGVCNIISRKRHG